MEKEMATHSSTFTWETPWREETGGLQFIGSQRVGQDLVTKQQQSYNTGPGFHEGDPTLILAWRGGDQGLEGLQDAAWGWGSAAWGGRKDTVQKVPEPHLLLGSRVSVCGKLPWQHRWGDTGMGPARARDLSLGSGRGSLKPLVSVRGGYLFALAYLQPPPRGSCIPQS